MTASFFSMRTEKYKTDAPATNNYVFYYTLHNTTNHDYRINSQSDLTTMIVLDNGQALGSSGNNEVVLDYFPLFIPANQSVQILFHFLAIGYQRLDGFMPEPLDHATATAVELRVEKSQLAQFLNSSYPRLSGFRFYDNTHRYQIDLPKEW